MHSSSNIGRHHPPARQLLSQANLPTLSGSLEQQSYLLLNTVLEASWQLTPADAVVYKKEYLSIATKSLIEDSNNTSTLDTERLTKLRKAVKRRVKKDKRQFICDNLLQDSKGPPSKQWSTLKFIRRPYVPRTQGVLDSSGKICSKNQKAETFAKHLADNMWCSSQHADLNTELLYPLADLPIAPFTEHELDMALHEMRHRRAPGPDHAPVDLWKFSPRQFRLLLLSHYNEVFATASSPSAWSLAHVVMIFKGKNKDPKLPSNYRPISLVNTVYKIYASMLHTRLKLAVDDRISPSQYGFRAGRSTSAPLFVIRRLLELRERHGVSFTLSSWTGLRPLTPFRTRPPAFR